MKPLRNLEFDAAAFEDLAWWVEHDRAQALRIVRLIRDVQRELPAQSVHPVRPGRVGALRRFALRTDGARLTCDEQPVVANRASFRAPLA